MSSKLLLQIAVALVATIPVAKGLPGALKGLPPDPTSRRPDLPPRDSDHRYWATVWGHRSTLRTLRTLRPVPFVCG